MQMGFAFGAHEDVAWMRDRLRAADDGVGELPVRTPVGQLVKSSISSRTRDAVSLAAYERLVSRYPDWPSIAAASVTDIEGLIADVTYPDVKARHLHAMLRLLAALSPAFNLGFLSELGVSRALGWLERLPGVGRKVSASTLNFSTLAMPAFVVDTHILRILRRFGLVRPTASTETAYDVVMSAAAGWSAAALGELHILMKRLGQARCRADRGDCPRCPIAARCRTAIGGARHR